MEYFKLNVNHFYHHLMAFFRLLVHFGIHVTLNLLSLYRDYHDGLGGFAAIPKNDCCFSLSLAEINTLSSNIYTNHNLFSLSERGIV